VPPGHDSQTPISSLRGRCWEHGAAERSIRGHLVSPTSPAQWALASYQPPQRSATFLRRSVSDIMKWDCLPLSYIPWLRCSSNFNRLACCGGGCWRGHAHYKESPLQPSSLKHTYYPNPCRMSFASTLTPSPSSRNDDIYLRKLTIPCYSWDFFLVDFVVPWRTRRSWRCWHLQDLLYPVMSV